MNAKIIIMYSTAIMAEKNLKKPNSFYEQLSCEEIVNRFNEGEHIFPSEDKSKSYSVIG
jgi:hypothetical protein